MDTVSLNNFGQAYLDLLRTHHRVTIGCYILDTQRNVLGNATGRVISGAVDMDVDASVTRSGKISILDPNQDLGLNFSGATMGSDYYTRMVTIHYVVENFERTAWYSIPIFTGPIVDATRDGVVVNLEFKGMETYAMYGLLHDHAWPPGWLRSQIIVNAMTGFAGEVHFRDWSGGGGTMATYYGMAAGENLWEKCKELADAMACHIYYDGNGVLNMKPKTAASYFNLDTTWLTEEPDLAFEIEKIKNVVRVEGATVPTGPDTSAKLIYEAWPPPQHPFSPQSLARYGVPRVMPRIIEDNALGSFADMSTVAWQNLGWDLLASAGCTAVSLVAPFLEEFDVVTLNHPKLYINVSVGKWTIPLIGDAEMSLNMFTSTSSGPVSQANYVSNAGLWGRMNMPGVRHGPSGAFNTLGGVGDNTKGEDWYGPGKQGGAPGSGGKGGKKKRKKKNKDKKGGGKK